MLHLTINGQACEVGEGTTVLQTCRSAGIEVPTLCHDDRLKPCAACRLCLVTVQGSVNPVPACSTPVTDGMVIETHTTELEESRKATLELLAASYPPGAVEQWPDKQFHRWLKRYGVIPGPAAGATSGTVWNSEFGLVGNSGPRFSDTTHPYLHVDMTRCIDCFRCVRICDELQGQFVWHDLGRGAGTRIVPDGPTLLASPCVSCGACADTCPTGALEDQSVLRHGHPTVWTRTTCPYCGTGCELNVGTRAGRIVQVRPVPDARVSKGHLCVKGRYAFEFAHSEERLTEPMIREDAWRAFNAADGTNAPFPLTPALSPRERANVSPSPDNSDPDDNSQRSELADERRMFPPLPEGEGRGEGKRDRLAQQGWRIVSWPEAIGFVAHQLSRIASQSGPDSIGVLGSARGTNEENYLAQKFARVVLGTNNVDCCARVCHAPTAAGMKQTLGTGAATNSFDDIEHAAAFLICGCNPTENHPIIGARIKQAVLHGAQLIVIDPRAIELTRYAGLHLQLRPGTNVPLFNALAHVIVTEGLADPAALSERVADFEAFREFISAWTPERAAPLTGVPADLIRQAARAYATAKPAMCFHGLGMTEHVQGTDGVMCLVNLALLTGNFGKPGSGVNPLRGQNNVQGSAHMGCEPGNLTGYIPLAEGRDLFESVWQAPLPAAKGMNLMQMVDAAAVGKLKALWAIGYDVALTNPNAAVTRAALAKLDLVIVQDLFLNELARDFAHVVLPACSSFEKDGTFMNSERRVQRVRRAMEPVGQSRSDWEIICDVAAAMGHGGKFSFQSAGSIWEEVRRVWPAGAGITYERLEHGGLQWPCLNETHPGTAILHQDSFPSGRTAPLKRVEFVPTEETTNAEFPFLLSTGRTLYQFNAGTMTMRTPNAQLRGTDTLDLAPADAARLGVMDGDQVRVRSRHGEATMPVKVDERLKPGELFATFHAAEVFLNRLTSPQRDTAVQTPEFKVVAVAVERVS